MAMDNEWWVRVVVVVVDRSDNENRSSARKYKWMNEWDWKKEERIFGPQEK